ncbi:MAG: LysE family transporter [Streptosporangiaceae bacterium]
MDAAASRSKASHPVIPRRLTGVAIGQGVWTVAASLGRTSLLRASAPAFLALKAAGAVYLVFLGVRLVAGQR